MLIYWRETGFLGYKFLPLIPIPEVRWFRVRRWRSCHRWSWTSSLNVTETVSMSSLKGNVGSFESMDSMDHFRFQDVLNSKNVCKHSWVERCELSTDRPCDSQRIQMGWTGHVITFGFCWVYQVFFFKMLFIYIYIVDHKYPIWMNAYEYIILCLFTYWRLL